jgi:Protein of unknown function (DUF1572)
MSDSTILETEVKEFRNLKTMAEKAMAQVSDKDFFRRIDSESNSIAILVKHLAGNMRSRWTDFLTTDGEKPDRDRDGEFVIDAEDTRASLEARWQAGLNLAFGALEALSDADLGREVLIRGEPHTVLKAICRNLSHFGYHAGQIVFLAKHFSAERWQTLSIPRNPSRVPKGKMPPSR